MGRMFGLITTRGGGRVVPVLRFAEQPGHPLQTGHPLIQTGHPGQIDVLLDAVIQRAWTRDVKDAHVIRDEENVVGQM